MVDYNLGNSERIVIRFKPHSNFSKLKIWIVAHCLLTGLHDLSPCLIIDGGVPIQSGGIQASIGACYLGVKLVY